MKDPEQKKQTEQKKHLEQKEPAVQKKHIDPSTTVIPMAIILMLCVYFVMDPEGSTAALAAVRFFLGDTLGSYYLVVGLGVLIVSFYLSYSDIGNIVLGRPDEKPEFGFWIWGAMVFTCGLAADILFYSLCEWIYYAEEPHIQELGSVQDWASAYPIYHWSMIPWSFYAVLSACFGFMLYVRNRKKQKFSESCRPILKEGTDGVPGRLVDILAVFALIAGTATTFSVSSPLLAQILSSLAGVENTKWVTIAILLAVCATYTMSVMHGIKGVAKLSNICMALFGALLLYVFVTGGEAMYIVETGIAAEGNVAQNFIALSTWTDALRTSSFPQNWTIFYWAYWMVWAVAAPFFMGSVSRGRTVRQVIMGSYLFGVSSTIISFIVLGNYGMGLQMHGKFDAIALYEASGSLYETILGIVGNLPFHKVALVLIVLSMMAFYASSFDSITLVACQYSYKEVDGAEDASVQMKLFWAVLLILLPIALIFNESSMNNMQTVSIIAAFPLGFAIILIIASFIKDAKDYIGELKKRTND
ncbi:MAG: BCCT family transporter [Stomatobaculum sp.]|nr:BCCT family transporter [Stomatobaculum sp.]